jgi:HAE1 family hydrophobic/amphiphilic exporter-1
MGPKEAALSGAGEMGLAITLATLTTIVVFLPLIVMGDNGEMQFWLLRIGVPVMLSLLASLVIALLLIPLATKVFAEKVETKKGAETQSRLSAWYISSLRWTLGQRSYASIAIVALLVLSFALPFKKIGQGLNSGGQQDVRLRYEFPGGQDIETVESYFDTVYDYLDSQKPRYNFDTYSSFYWAEEGSIQLQFDEAVKPWYVTGYQSILGSFGLWKNPHLTREEIVEDLRKNVSAPPGAQLRFNSKDQDPTKIFNIALYGDDTETLKRISQEVERRLRAVDGLVAVETEDDMQRQEMNITLDREKANHYGIETQMISGAISYAIRGNQVGYFYDSNGRRSRIRIWLDENDQESINHIRKLTFEGSDGALVPLESLASLSYESGARAIRRQDRKTVMRVQGIATKEDSTELFKQVDAVMKDLELPRGYRWDKGGRYQQLQESNQTLTFTLLMIVVFIILLMGAMFESFILPFSIFLTMPLAGVGVVWTLYLTKTSFNIMASIGTIILLGVVVNNGIVLIDLITRLRSQGMERLDAIIEAGKRRFRPIWMTSLTTICGMIPMSLGDTKMIDMSYSPLGRAMMGGMLTATVLTLLVVPLFYTLFDDLRVMFFGYIRSIFQKTNTAEHRSESLEATD